MGIKFGEIDAGQILDNEFRVGVLERLLDWLLKENPQLRRPSPDDVRRLRREAVEVLQKKYPKSGISYKET